MTRFLDSAAFLPGFAPGQSYAPGKVWSGSTSGEPRFAALSKRMASRIFHDARRFERQTRTAGHQDGKLGRNGLAVLHALIFDFLNYASGRLDPSYAAIARAANVSLRSAARGLKRLKAAGVLNWVRRCSWVRGSSKSGFVLNQDSNAYAVIGPNHWHGYAGRPPAPEEWGAHPPIRGVLASAADEFAHGQTKAAIAALESDSTNALAAQIAALARRRL